MRKITLEEYETRFPQSNQSYFEKLSGEQKETYLKMVNAYYHFLNCYLVQKFDLLEYDQIFINSPAKYMPTLEEDMDIYQFLAADTCKYLYIRNNCYVERLSKDEISYLYSIASEEELTPEIEKFIENTYKKVIVEKVDSNVKTNYGPESPSFFAEANALVLGFRYDQFYEEKEQEKWKELHEKRLMEIPFASFYIQNKLSAKLDMPVKVLEYDNWSIKKKDDYEQTIDKSY